MDANHRQYNFFDSDERIQEILESNASFEDKEDIPAKFSLTHTNGFYVDCTAIFIDIRGSSQLTKQYSQRRTLGKVYRAYVSECVAALNGDSRCRQVFIQGDCVSAVFSTPTNAAINEIFHLVAKLNSVIALLNFRLAKKGLTEIRCGIGIDTGRALMLKAGFSGSGINDVIWMGDVLNRASGLCHQGAKKGALPIQVSRAVAEALDKDNQKFLTQGSGTLHNSDQFECNVVDVQMKRYLEEEEAKSQKPKGLLHSAIPSAFLSPPSLLSGLANTPPMNNTSPQWFLGNSNKSSLPTPSANLAKIIEALRPK